MLLLRLLRYALGLWADRQAEREAAEQQAAIDRAQIKALVRDPHAGSPMGVRVRQSFPNPYAKTPPSSQNDEDTAPPHLR